MPANGPQLPRPTDPQSGYQRFWWRLGQGRLKAGSPAIDGAEPVWTATMTWIAATALILTVAVGLFDGRINAAVLASDSPLRGFMTDWTDIVRSQWYLVPAGILIVVAGFADWGKAESGTRRVWSNIYAQSVFVFVSVSGALMTTNVFKIIIGRARPLLYDQFGALHVQPFTIAWEYASFPSGHSTTAATLTVILMAWMPRFRWLFLGAGLFMAATRVAAHAHYPSDIVAGFAVGFLFTLSLARWLARHRIGFRTEPGRLIPTPRFRTESAPLPPAG